MENGTETENLELLMPDGTDYYTIDDANYNTYHIDEWAGEVEQALDGKADRSEILSATLNASSWTGSGPYYYDLSGAGIVAGHNYIISDACTTSAQRQAFLEASVGINYSQGGGSGFAAGHLYLVAWFAKPTVNLPIKIEKR